MADNESTATYSGLFTKGTQSVIDSTSIEDGKIRLSTDSHRLFFDFTGVGRIEVTDIIRQYTQAQLESGSISTTGIQNKLFVATDTLHLFFYNITEQELQDITDIKVTAAGTADTATSANNGISDITRNGLTFTVTKADGSTFTFTQQDTDTTYDEMEGATSSAAGTSGLVPAPSAGDQDKFLNGSGNWGVPSYTANAGTATYAENAGTANYVESASSADYASTAGHVESASSATLASSATADGNGDTITSTYAKLASPVFTGTPTVPTPASGDDSGKIANTEFVNAAITSAIGSITGVDFVIVQTLPATGEAGNIYLVPKASSESADDEFDEYIWLTTESKFEHIGSTSVDLSGYVNDVTITGTGNAVTGVTKNGQTITLTKGATFLTAHPEIVINQNTTSSVTPAAGSTFTAIDAITKDSNGHVTSYNTKTVTIPNQVSSATHASTANYATNAGTANYGTNAGTANYATKAGTATHASTADYATKAGTATAAMTTYSMYIGQTGSTANRMPYYGGKASTATNLAYNFDFGDIDSATYYF